MISLGIACLWHILCPVWLLPSWLIRLIPWNTDDVRKNKRKERQKIIRKRNEKRRNYMQNELDSKACKIGSKNKRKRKLFVFPGFLPDNY